MSWLKDGKVISEDDLKYQFIQNGNKYEMKILNCILTDMGQYTVKAKGKPGEVTAAFALNVYPTTEL